MRRFLVVVLAAALVLPVGLLASPAGAAVNIACASYDYTQTYSPGLPVQGDPTTVTPTITQTASFGGCVGLGITGGTATFAGVSPAPANCDIAESVGVGAVGNTTIHWSNGQTSTMTNLAPITQNGSQITSGLFTGALLEVVGGGNITFNPGACVTSPQTKEVGTRSEFLVLLPPGNATCTSPQACNTTRSGSATTTAPGLAVTATGTPTVGAGQISLSVASAKLACPKVPAISRPVAHLTDVGFTPTDKVSVTATLPVASSTSAEQVCFNSTVPFKSQSNPTVAKAGTAFLLLCTQTANVAPCVTSSKQVGANVVVKFVAPGGDPNFCIVPPPTGKQAWLLHFGTGKVGTTLSMHLETTGAVGAVHWSIVSGKLPRGVVLNATTGVISGKPTAKGSSTVKIQATDSQGVKTSPLPVPITVT